MFSGGVWRLDSGVSNNTDTIFLEINASNAVSIRKQPKDTD